MFSRADEQFIGNIAHDSRLPSAVGHVAVAVLFLYLLQSNSNATCCMTRLKKCQAV